MLLRRNGTAREEQGDIHGLEQNYDAPGENGSGKVQLDPISPLRSKETLGAKPSSKSCKTSETGNGSAVEPLPKSVPVLTPPIAGIAIAAGREKMANAWGVWF